MAGRWLIFVCVLPAALLAGSDAGAFHGSAGLWGPPATVSTYYYYPAPSYGYSWTLPSYACPAGPTIIPLEKQRGIYANPIPAPPSPTTEPPLNKKTPTPSAKVNSSDKPAIITTHSLSGPLPVNSSIPQKDQCRIGFWNLSGRDITLTIEGRAWTLQKGRALTMDLQHQFAWQVDQRPEQVERIPDNQTTHELVIRE